MKIRIAVVAIIGVAAVGACRATLRAREPAPVLAGPATSSSQPARSVWDGVYTEEQATRGAQLFTEECAFCHGDGLEGGEEAPPLAGGEFTANWNGVTLGELLDRMRETMPIDDPGRLSRQKNADILAYILSANQFPAGTTKLPRQSGILQQILFKATKN